MVILATLGSNRFTHGFMMEMLQLKMLNSQKNFLRDKIQKLNNSIEAQKRHEVFKVRNELLPSVILPPLRRERKARTWPVRLGASGRPRANRSITGLCRGFAWRASSLLKGAEPLGTPGTKVCD